MSTSDFDPRDFVNKIGERLVLEFEHASVAGTPSLIGAARENPARKQLEKLLPAFVAAGSGIVIDSFGAKSSQQDIVFYERDFCPVYSINDTPEATYFPIEGVIATGEVKSVVDKATLFDALNKVRSSKLLRRFSEKTKEGPWEPVANYRSYGSGSTFAAVPEHEYDQAAKYRDQIYSFIICKSFKQSPDAILENLCEYVQMHGPDDMPNLIVSLNDGFVQSTSLPSWSLQHSPLTGNAFAFVPEIARAFMFLVNGLRQHAQEGRSVPVHSFQRYTTMSDAPLPEGRTRPYLPRSL
jgi:hypothetical protein